MLNRFLGKALAIKDEGVTITQAASSLDMVGSGISASASGDDVTETVSGTSLSNPVTVSQGGTGATSLTGVLIGNGTSVVTAVALGALQSIRMNSAGTAYEAYTPSSSSGGTVTSVSVVTANGVSASIATATTTPAITFTLGAITPSAVQISGLTASEIVITDSSKNLVSAAVATYPSLTELTYVKGVTSAIQTQLNAKQATLTNSAGLASAINDETGTGVAVFSTSPQLTTSLTTDSTTFALLNATATTINFAGAATTLNIGTAATCILNFGGSTTASEFRFLEPSGSGTNYSAFKAVAQTANITYSLPPAVGAAGTYLKDVAGDGVLTWAAAGGATAVTVSPLPNGNPVQTELGISVNTTAHFGQIIIPFSITVNKLSINVATNTTAGDFDIALYSEDGQTKYFEVTITTSGTGLQSVAVSSVALSPGVYYVGIVSNGTANNAMEIWGNGDYLNNPSSEPVLEGTATVTAGTLPATISPTAGITAANRHTLMIRLDN